MIVRTDTRKKHIVLTGERFEVRLTWSQALALGSLLTHHSREIEPPARPGRTYTPAVERER